ncbi:hypothetical protein AK812_SmicGene21330 [Symbiodinium microadriaticum]|uniref:UBX domain-containing protein n=1 Tax=Symbiodinium microadriaticum TaxID=2951 RepID=A0A1Q9DMR3_SYMMI|nr:hypothetical protein AK812_SmicGene21330 [Symbiodinium microadriaticum]
MTRPPADEAGRLQFQIRIPDGRRLKRAFRPEDSIGQVYAYACVEGGEALVTREFRLVETMPRRTYEEASLVATARLPLDNFDLRSRSNA